MSVIDENVKKKCLTIFLMITEIITILKLVSEFIDTDKNIRSILEVA